MKYGAVRKSTPVMEKTIKKQVGDLLRQREIECLLDLCEKDRHYWHEVRFRLYDLDERLRWAAIQTVAKLMHRSWQADKEDQVRQYVRTLFWSLNDESGGIGWSSPQVISEIIAQIPAIADPYGSMMIACTIDEPPLIKGCLWGIGRMGSLIASSLASFQQQIIEIFQIDDAETLGLASWAMGEACFVPAVPFLEKIQSSAETVRIYMENDFLEKPLGQWAREALAHIKISP
jgi:hypothetical protein